MDDLISRKALLAEYDRVHIGEPGKARKLIEDAPAVEVVHGRGLDVRETEMHVPELKLTSKKTAETCSESKVRINFIGAERRLFAAICPTCGAIMPEV